MFRDGVSLEEYYETTEGLLWVTYRIVVAGGRVIFRDFVVYPVTGTHMQAGVGQVLQLFRSLRNRARDEGFFECTLEADRVSQKRPKRMISIMRRLR
jgi:hypothetical protein